VVEVRSDWHIGMRAEHAAGLLAFDPCEFSEMLDIRVRALDVAARPPQRCTSAGLKVR
jgi:hypothetical protein